MTTVGFPQFTDNVDLRYFLEPLSAPAHPQTYLDRFPDALYNKALDSHFVRFMYALLGPVGIGYLKANIASARLQLEAAGIHTFDLESFYGDPFAFGRILTESFDNDISGLLPSAAWDTIRAQDESYRSRAIQFLNGARLGGTPKGLELAASSGIGQTVEIVENYRALFDNHSDDPLGLPFRGTSNTSGEFIVVPRPYVSQTRQQTIQFSLASTPLGENQFTIALSGYTTPAFASGVTPPTVQTALEGLPTIGAGNVLVTGGPAPSDLVVSFMADLGNRNLPALQVQFTDSVAGLVEVPVLVTTGALDPTAENVPIADIDRHQSQVAIDYLRPVATYPTFFHGSSTLRPQPWASVTASTEYSQVVRYVTGNPGIGWPAPDNLHWIEAAVENEAPKLQDTAPQHYVSFHNPVSVAAYTDQALSDPSYATTSAILGKYNSVHVGSFAEMGDVMPFFSQFDTDYNEVFSAGRVLADYTEPLTISALAPNGTAFINGIYPADYLNLSGVPDLVYTDADFWSSMPRQSGADILEIDLGSPQAVNYITMEVTRKPVSVSIDYDLSDQAPARSFAPVTYVPGFSVDTQLYFDPSFQSPWEPLHFYFNDGLSMIFTRFIRLTFTRRPDSTTYGRFLYDTSTQTQTPWSVDVRNLRVGRNIAPTVT